jgi:hypothetical protein
MLCLLDDETTLSLFTTSMESHTHTHKASGVRRTDEETPPAFCLSQDHGRKGKQAHLFLLLGDLFACCCAISKCVYRLLRLQFAEIASENP